MGVFCPDLRFLMNTQDVVENSFFTAENFLETNEELRATTVYALSKESAHKNDLVVALN